MIGPITRRIRIIVDRILIRTKPMGSMNQVHWGMELASDVFARAYEKNPQVGYKKHAGRILWETLPHDMAPVVIRTWFDPYEKEMTKQELRDWLWAHVIFDYDGNIIAIHDRGEIFTYLEGWYSEVDWFNRVKMGNEEIWAQANRERAKVYG